MALNDVILPRPSLLGETVKQFAETRIRPQAERWDALSEYPAEIYDDLAQMGLLGITIPEEYGGGGGSFADFAETMELLSWGYASVADHVGLVELVGHIIARYGSPDQVDSFLRPMLAGTLQCAYALTEPGSGSDLASIRTRATRKDDRWIIDGEKIFIHNAPVADFALVLAVTDPDLRTRGMSAFLVPLDLPGVSVTGKFEKLGQRGSPLAGIHLDSVVVSDTALLGEEGRGFHYVMWGLDIGRLGIASLALGISRAALVASTEHAKSREQFGKPIGTNQGIAFPLADMATEYRAARALISEAAARLDAGERASVACSMAKLYASEACVRHASSAVQIHGGSGYIRGVEVERLYRDCRITMIYEGTSEIQRMVIARQLLG